MNNYVVKVYKCVVHGSSDLSNNLVMHGQLDLPNLNIRKYWRRKRETGGPTLF